MIKRVGYLIGCIAILNLYACLEVATQVKNWIEAKNIDQVIGKYHYLEDDGIKIYLPEVFKRYSSVEYQKIIDSLVSDKNLEYEHQRLKFMREMEGNLYIFFDEVTRSSYTINTVPYTPLYKQDAQFLLRQFRLSQERITKNTDLSITKLTAKYSARTGPQIFKAVYRIDHTQKKVSVYCTNYIISSSNKTVVINLTTPIAVNFDPFLQKMIL